LANEFLHAPSEAQALVAAIIRDRAQADAEPERWQMNLDSNRIRVANELAAEVRLGSHISEALGRAVERAVGEPDSVAKLRLEFPIRTEHEGRRVCDGQAVLARFAEDPNTLDLDQSQLQNLAALAAATDVYGDLLVANAVFDVVSGRTEVAQASMEAAAGLAVPPTLEVIRTQREGRSVTTSVVVALYDAADPSPIDAMTSPGRIADPAAAAYLDTAFGSPTEAPWTWQVIVQGESNPRSLSLADIGLTPVDTLSLSTGDLMSLVTETVGMVLQVDDFSIEPDTGLDAHDRVRRMSNMLGQQPVVAADLSEKAPEADADTPIRTDLGERYARLHEVAGLLLEKLEAVTPGSEEEQWEALVAASRWGITPMRVDGDSLTSRLQLAAEALKARRQAQPAPVDATALSIPELAATIAELGSPEGRLPVLARYQLDQLPVTLSEDAAGVTGVEAIDPHWLEIVAAVRAPVARLEAHQIEQRTIGGESFAAWTNRPGDPWQRTVSAEALEEGIVPTSRLVAAFGPVGAIDAGTDPSRSIALGLVDSWGETIPETQHATNVAIHVDAPASRAPQAILIAVPAALDSEPDTGSLLEIVRETRELVRARMATPQDLAAFAAGIPLTWLPAAIPDQQRGVPGYVELEAK